jgi:calcineurin-like phosphoesterase family protein
VAAPYNMSKIFLISDQHYSHRNTLRYCGRPFFTTTQMDEAMIKRHNSVVAPGDKVYHLGDFTMHTAPLKRILPRLNGIHYLVSGNHDLVYAAYFEKTRGKKFIDKMHKEYHAAGFSMIFQGEVHLTTRIGKVRLCHFPTKNTYDSYHNDKHDASRPEDDGTLNICGHIHQHWKKRGNNINIGVDIWDFTPVNLETVLSLFTEGSENIETPHKFRIFVWKMYHTLVWKLSNLLKNK